MEINKVVINWTGVLEIVDILALSLERSLSPVSASRPNGEESNHDDTNINDSMLRLHKELPFINRPQHPPRELVALMIEFIRHNISSIKESIPTIINLINGSIKFDISTLSSLAGLTALGKIDNRSRNLLAAIDNIQADIAAHWVNAPTAEGESLPEHYFWPTWLDVIHPFQDTTSMIKTVYMMVRHCLSTIDGYDKMSMLQSLANLELIDSLVRSPREVGLNSRGREKIMSFTDNILQIKKHYSYYTEQTVLVS